MTCTVCHKEMIECRCRDAIDRLRWLLSSDSPVVFSVDKARAIKRRITELEGERELRDLKP